MITPLKNWKSLKRGYKFRQRTFYSKHHLGLDLICERGTPIYAPCDGFVRTMTGFQGGKTIWFYFEEIIMRVLHLAEFQKTGKVRGGDIIGSVGNTGVLTRGDHAHIDLSKNKVDIHDINNFLDPETFFSKINNKKMTNVKLIRNGEEIGFYVPSKSPEALIDKAMNFGIEIPLTESGDVDWAKLPIELFIK